VNIFSHCLCYGEHVLILFDIFTKIVPAIYRKVILYLFQRAPLAIVSYAFERTL